MNGVREADNGELHKLSCCLAPHDNYNQLCPTFFSSSSKKNTKENNQNTVIHFSVQFSTFCQLQENTH